MGPGGWVLSYGVAVTQLACHEYGKPNVFMLNWLGSTVSQNAAAGCSGAVVGGTRVGTCVGAGGGEVGTTVGTGAGVGLAQAAKASSNTNNNSSNFFDISQLLV
jgi:hypothetical protein